MTRIDLFLKELEAEAKTTRKMLAIVPNDKYDWKPHPKSMNIRSLATHIAELPTWASLVLTTTELDFAKEPYNPTIINDTKDLVALFERSMLEAKGQLLPENEKKLEEKWILRNGEQIYSEQTKAENIRHAISQTIHHRAQLGVFLRLLDIPIPGSYGPSADDQSF
ncbi:MAG: DinB family protein [Bacteroidetes bacterium]|nr:DinB family protein [Bacteroidota bacterium]